jgi:hypothetical protein
MSMVETIAPVVHGGRRSSYWSTVAVHALGATLGAAALGAVLGGLGAVLGAPWGTAGLVALAAIATLYALREGAGLPIPIPDRHKQVPDWWRTFYSPRVAGFLYGVGLGVGWLTYVSYGTLAAVSAAAFLSGHPLAGAVLLAPFGLARALSVTITAGTTSEGEVVAAVAVLEKVATTTLPRAVNATALALIAAAAATGL